jgi:hypothetical protein
MAWWTTMSGTDRWRLMTRGFVAWVAIGVLGTAAALAARRPTAALVAAVFLGLGFSLLVPLAIAANGRPGLFVPPDMEGLDDEQRRLVNYAVRTGTYAGRPELAPAVVGEVRRTRYVSALLGFCWFITVAIRVASFRSDPALLRLLDVLLVVGVVAGTASVTRSLWRARQAESLNRVG